MKCRRSAAVLVLADAQAHGVDRYRAMLEPALGEHRHVDTGDGIHTAALRTRFADALLAAIPNAFVNGHETERIPGNLSITFPNVEVDEVLRADPGLGMAMGSACTSGRADPSHVLLAMVILPMAIMSLTRGLRGQFARHRVIARRTFPLWMYVSVTGVIVYLMLYQLY